jgi:hypothetical protein
MKPLAVVLALAAGLLAGASALRESFEYLVAPATDANPRNSEADMLRLRDGRLLLAWTEFYTTKGSDWGPARISAMFSSDQGRAWSSKRTLQENIGQMNVMEPDLLRLRSGKVLFVFCRKNSEADCLPMLRVSRDDARTFSEPVPLPVTPYPSYTGTNHDRLVQLKSGNRSAPLYDWRSERAG